MGASWGKVSVWISLEISLAEPFSCGKAGPGFRGENEPQARAGEECARGVRARTGCQGIDIATDSANLISHGRGVVPCTPAQHV